MHERGNLGRSVHHQGVWDFATRGDWDWTPFGPDYEAQVGPDGVYTGWLRPAGGDYMRRYEMVNTKTGERRQALNWKYIRDEATDKGAA